MKRFNYICPICQGDDVVWDAWASWDSKTQENVLEQSFDDCFCRDCEKSIHAEEVVIDE